METLPAHLRVSQGVHRRDVLQAGLAAGVTLAAWSLPGPSGLWGAEAGQPRRGGILRVRGYDPIHFDHHLSPNFKTSTTLSFVYSKLVRHTVGAGVQSRAPSASNPIWPSGGRNWTTQPMSSICAKGSNGTINRRSTAANWWPRM